MLLLGSALDGGVQHVDLQPLTPKTATVSASAINMVIIQFTFFIVVFSFFVLCFWFSGGLQQFGEARPQLLPRPVNSRLNGFRRAVQYRPDFGVRQFLVFRKDKWRAKFFGQVRYGLADDLDPL